MPCNLTGLLSEPQSRDVVLAQAIGTSWESGPQPRGQRGQWLSVGFNIERNTASELGDAPKATRGGFTREESACPSLHVTPLSLKTHLLTGIRLVPESTGLAALGVTTVYRGQTLLGKGGVSAGSSVCPLRGTKPRLTFTTPLLYAPDSTTFQARPTHPEKTASRSSCFGLSKFRFSIPKSGQVATKGSARFSANGSRRPETTSELERETKTATRGAPSRAPTPLRLTPAMRGPHAGRFCDAGRVWPTNPFWH